MLGAPEPIEFPTPEETEAALEETFGKMRSHQAWLKERAEGWQEALLLVGKVAAGDTGQSATCRAFLWACWRWKPEPDPISGRQWSPIELRALDGELVRAIAKIEAWVCLPTWLESELRNQDDTRFN